MTKSVLGFKRIFLVLILPILMLFTACGDDNSISSKSNIYSVAVKPSESLNVFSEDFSVQAETVLNFDYDTDFVFEVFDKNFKSEFFTKAELEEKDIVVTVNSIQEQGGKLFINGEKNEVGRYTIRFVVDGHIADFSFNILD